MTEPIFNRLVEAYNTIESRNRQRMVFVVGTGVFDALIAEQIREAQAEIDRQIGLMIKFVDYNPGPLIKSNRAHIQSLMTHTYETEGAKIFGLPLTVDRALASDAIEVRHA